MIAALSARAIADAGLTPIDCGEVPTPALALAGMNLCAPSVMVTGSHIPDDRNGLKFYRAQGEIDKADEARILHWHAKLALASVPAERAATRPHEALAAYQARYATCFGTAALKGLTVGVYQHSSVGRDAICQTLKALGAEVVPLGRAERFIPLDTEALRQEDEELARGWAAEWNGDSTQSSQPTVMPTGRL